MVSISLSKWFSGFIRRKNREKQNIGFCGPYCSDLVAFFFNVELADYVDAGVAFNINYECSYADGYLEAIINIRQGDIGLWTKIRVPFISDSSVYGLATQIDLYMPTEKKYLGLRPRHAWHIRGRGETRMKWLLLHYIK